MRHTWLRFPLLLLTLAAPWRVAANPGQLDPTYGTGGVASVELDGEGCFASVLQPDGKVVLVGNQNLYPNRQLALVRFDTDGTPDPTFGVNGVSVITSGVNDPQPHGMVVLPNGKFIVSGFVNGLPHFLGLVRLNADGSLDTTFGAGGVLDVPITGAYKVALQSDGMILVAGNTAGLSSGADFGVARYDADGVLDTTFGTAGLARADLTSFDQAYGLSVQPDGRILVVGGTNGGPLVSRFGVARFLPDGTLDPTFGIGGTVLVPTISEYDVPEAVATQSTGRVVVAGFSAVSHPTFLDADWALVGLAANGSADGAFGAGGTVLKDFAGYDDIVYALHVQPDDRVLVAGYAGFGAGYQNLRPLVSRYLANGALDLGWGLLGTTIVTVPDIYNGDMHALHALPDGRILGTGSINVTSGGTLCAAVRFLNNTCGNGVIEPGEDCDDGNTANGDCCSSTCHFDPVGQACASDGLTCTVDECDGAGTCRHPAQLLPGCRHSIAPLKGRLTIKNNANDARDALTWAMQKGAATAIAELGNPLVFTNYTLCGIDVSSSTFGLLFEIDAPAGGTCANASCWGVSGGSGFKYRDKDRTPSGMASLLVKSGTIGKAKASASAKGVHLGLPTLPLPLPAIVQLRASSGLCFETGFSSAGVQRNDASQFKGKAD